VENVPRQHNLFIAKANDRRVTGGGPAAVLERVDVRQKTQSDPCLAAKMGRAALD
jgi:hypothetical protein